MLVYGDKRFKGIGVTNGIGLDTSDADITPADMQNGRMGYANGQKVIGTGKCFEKAGYGQRKIKLITDENGNKKYGISILTKTIPNIIFVSSTNIGDIVLQENFVFSLIENERQKIGVDYITSGEISAYHNGSFLNIYFENIENTETKLMYFYGKDNYI